MQAATPSVVAIITYVFFRASSSPTEILCAVYLCRHSTDRGMADRFPSISARSGDIDAALSVLKARAEEIKNHNLAREINDVIARFHLWAGNVGAFHHPSQALSLDSRVSESTEIRDLICEHLQDLKQASADRTICSPRGSHIY